MRELQILFSTPMVEAILENRKTMTRRTSGLEYINKLNQNGFNLRYDSIEDGVDENGFVWFEELNGVNETEDYRYAKPRYQVGDQLWVRETFFDARKWKHAPLFSDGPDFIYRADEDAFIGEHKWKPSLFMPKAAARIWLEVTDVKCERLQDITEANAIDEGIEFDTTFRLYKCPVCSSGTHKGCDLLCSDGFFITAKLAFQSLWHSINGVDSWDANPWVFVYEFKSIEKP